MPQQPHTSTPQPSTPQPSATPQPPARILEAIHIPRDTSVLELQPLFEDILAGRRSILPLPPEINDATKARAELLRRTQRAGTDIDSAVSLVACTSGSTGTPKGAMLTSGNIAAAIAATEERLDGPGRWLLATPADHIAGLMVLLRSYAAAYQPAVMDLSHGFNAEAFAQVVAQMFQTSDAPRHYVSLVPLQLAKLMRHETACTLLTQFDAILLGGQAADDELLSHAATRGLRIVTTYGSSETCGGVVYNGKPLTGVSVTTDEIGRIVLSGSMVGMGYRDDNPALQHSRFITNDLGTWDGRRLSVSGRADDVIISGGLKFLPQPIEEVLRAHPQVATAIVVGVSDRSNHHLGQEIAAVVVPATDTEDQKALTQQLTEWASERLSKFQIPRRWRFVAELPTVDNGKVNRRQAQALFNTDKDGS